MPLDEAQASQDPTSIVGLELVDGSIARPPPSPAWGAPLASEVERQHGRRLAALRAELGPVWIAWDAAREAPRGIMTAGVPAPGTSSSAVVAELFAWAWLARQLDLLAPGASLGDFELVSNELDNGLRSLGFAQVHSGLPVVGGQLSLRFRADSLVYISAQALPHVQVGTSSSPAIPAQDARALAQAWIVDDYQPVSVSVAASVERVILPIYSGSASAGGFQYHDALRVGVEASDPLASWWVYLDATTGIELAREQRMMSEATVRYDVPVRRPDDAREDMIAPFVDVVETGNQATTDVDGQVALSASPTGLSTGVEGTYVSVNHAQGAEASANFNVSDNETVVWSAADNQFVDAQLSGFVHASRAKQYIRALDPDLGWLDETLQVTVNINQTCNAFSNGDSIFFFRANNNCQNTARLADVVYHEIGHSVHRQSLVPGVGSFDGALSEGIADYLAATMNDDSGMGRGFFYGNGALREINPDNVEYTWPEDIDEDVHYTGLIIAGALWDLRELLIAKLGEDEGVAATDRIYYDAHRRAFDIPSMYPEALLADDDDANLANGTPNACEINEAFAAHGLVDIGGIASSLSVELVQVAEGRQVELSTAAVMFDDCPIAMQGAALRWRDRADPDQEFSEPMVVQDGLWVATIPNQEPGVVIEYQVEAEWDDGSSSRRPLNPADVWYQTYFGGAQPIYCLDDEADLDAWTLSGPGNTWTFGPLLDEGDDPPAPYDDDGVLLSQEGTYLANANTRARSPLVDISGAQDVRLHYRRWLGVEDAFYDQAFIEVNGELEWQNVATQSTILHHRDREWRFHDVDISAYIPEGEVEVDFRLVSDGGLEFGGWTVDDLCIVEVVEAYCGDGWVSGEEQCDDGNLIDEDGCSALCEIEEEPEPGDGDGDPDPTGDGDGDPTGDGDGDPATGDGDGDPATGDGDGDGGGGSTDGGSGEDSTDTDTDTDEESGETGGPGADDPTVLDDGCNCSSSSEDEPRRGALGLLLLAGFGLVRRRR